jgi:SOS-response transcriptional repressor LexA
MDDIWTKLTALAGRTDIEALPLSEIAKRLGLAHRSQAKHYRDKAEKDGLLVRNSLGKLVPSPSDKNPSLVTLPVMGEANCGPALLFAHDEITGTVSFSPSTFKRKLRPGAFAVKTVGNSMNNANINNKTIEDGDMAVVEPLTWNHAAEGEYVLSVIDGMANIKRLHLDVAHKRIVLKSESRDDIFEDIILDAEDLYMYTLSGRVIDVIKGIQS